jgi:hypothetical protein
VELELLFDGSQDRSSATGTMKSEVPSIAAYPTRAEEPIDSL